MPEDDKESIVGSLRHLTNESLRQAGRRLATTLGDRTYLRLEPKEFFVKCYDLRSRVVHGATPFPTREEVGPSQQRWRYSWPISSPGRNSWSNSTSRKAALGVGVVRQI